MIVFIERIEHQHSGNGAGYAGREQHLREAQAGGKEVRIEAGKRAEFHVPAGARAVVHVLEGSVRFEGDDTQAVAGDVVWFKPAAQGGPSLLGIEADTAARALVVH
jgi:quercetin dioxygenase-like cupin family protein